MKKNLQILPKFFSAISLFAALFFHSFFSFSQCDTTVPVWTVDLSSNPDSVWDQKAEKRKDYCCGATGSNECIQFIVTLNPSVGGIYFGARNPGPSGSMYFIFECDSNLIFEVNKDTACVSGPGPHHITICKPGGDDPIYTIAGIGSGNISPPITVSNACFDTLFSTGFVKSSLIWTSVPSDTLYNSFMSCSLGCDTNIISPYGIYPDSLMYKVCGTLSGVNCGGGATKCDSTWVHFVTNFSTAISPQNPTICFGGTPATLTANTTGGAAPYTYLWNTGETTQSINVSSGNAGLYWVEVKDTLKCAGIRDSVTVTEFFSAIDANAGTDLMSCANNPPINLNGAIQAASGGIWSGGAGTFSPDDTTLNTVYTPDTAEISAGTATLFLTTTGNGTCPADTDTVQISISPSPVVDAGTNQTICMDNGAVILLGNISGGSSTGIWTTSGSGNFSPNDSLLNTSYNPSSSDISFGTITLYLTSTNNGQCFSVNDSLQINIIDSIKVNAGIDQIVCANNSITLLNGNVSGPTTTGVWTTSGTGNFSPNDSDFAATYTPSSTDTSAGTVTIILNSTNNGICNAISDTMILAITGIPQIDAGADETACKNNASTQLSGIISGGTITGIWTTNGDGNFSPNDSDLAAIYIAGNSDTANGNVAIFLTSTNNGGCNAVIDSLQINFTESPSVFAGTDQTICADATSVSLNGNVTISTGGIWTTNGSGNFSDDSLLNTTYIPDANDTASGIVEIILTTTGNGNCNAVSDTLLLTISDAPTVEAGTNKIVCANNADASLNGIVNISSGGIWTTSGSGNFSPNDSDLNATYVPSATDTSAGTVTIYLTSTGNGSCNAVSDSLQISITPAPIADAGADISVCKTNPDATLNGNVFISTGGIWTTSGSGNFSPNDSDLNATYIPSATDVFNGNVTLTLTTTGNVNCNAVSDDVLVTFTTDSIAVDAGNDTTVCSASFPLNGNVFIATGGVWTTNGSGTFSPDDSTLNASYTFSNSDTANGSVEFILTTLGNGGCAAKNDTVLISIADNISVNASAADSVCGNGDPVPVSAMSSTLSGVWSTLGIGSFVPSDSALNAAYIPGAFDISAGSATLVFSSANNNGCAPLTDTIIINLVPAPFTDFTADSVCLNNSTIFTDATTTVGSIISWNWDFGDGNSDTVQNTSHTYFADGNYIVTLVTESNFGCVDTMLKTIPVHPLPNVDFTTVSPCFVDSAVFNDLSTINSGNIIFYNWNFGDGNNSSLQNPSHLYASAGTYTISLNIISDFGCSDSISKTISIQPAPVANFSNTLGCTNSSVSFSDSTTISSGSIISYTWDFGDSTNSSSQNPSHIYSSDGTFDVQLIAVSDSGCSDTIVKQITVFPMPNADFLSTAQCFVDSVFFNDSSTISNGNIISYNWNFGDTTISSSQNPSHFYNSSGVYTATLIVVSDSGCADTISKTISVNPAPTADFANTNGCLEISTSFSDSSEISSGNIVSWSWNFGDGNNSSLQNPSHGFSSSDTFNVHLTVVSDSGCTDDTIIQVIVYPLPNAGFTSNPQCFVDSLYFTDTSAISSGNIVSWNWDFGDGNFSNDTNPAHVYSLGNYTVTLIVTSAFGCSDTISQNISAAPAPNAAFLMSTNTVCVGQPILFSSTSSIPLPSFIVSYNWDFGDGNSSTFSSDFHSFATSDTFTIVLTVTSNTGCVDDTSLQVIAYPSPVADFYADKFCINEPVEFKDSSIATPDTVVAWQWNFGDVAPNNYSQNPNHSYNAVGSYGVILIVTTNHGCKDTVTTAITVNPAPNADFDPDKTVAFTGDAFNFLNHSSEGISWFWDFGDTSGTSTLENPNYIYANGGTFIITLTAENIFGCSDTATDSVIVNVPPKVPNGFSPNGDGKNDALLPMGGPYKELEFKIYNNWGELIFISRKSDDGWDGTKQGIPQPMGVYVYMLDAITEDGIEYHLHGDVTLLR